MAKKKLNKSVKQELFDKMFENLNMHERKRWNKIVTEINDLMYLYYNSQPCERTRAFQRRKKLYTLIKALPKYECYK